MPVAGHRVLPARVLPAALTLALVVALSFLGLLLSTGRAAAATPAPTGLAKVAVAKSAMALRWNAVAGAPRYRIQISTSASMSGAVYHRFTDPAAELSGLKTGTAYYVKVRVITADGANLSPYSAAVKVSTEATGNYLLLPPVGLRGESAASTSAALSWTARSGASGYRLSYSGSSSMSSAKALDVSGTSGSVTGLASSTSYYVTVAALNGSGTAISRPSTAVKVTTATSTAGQVALRAASYNVKCANCYSKTNEELPWADRRDTVVAAIKAQDLDVIGIQEASQGWLKTASGASIDLSQFEDLQQRLGGDYRLTNTHRNNCVKSTTPTNCVYADRGASQGTKIIYNSARVSVVESGAKRLTSIDTTSNARYVAWAIFEQRGTGKQFFFADTHLEPQSDAAGSTRFATLRRTQAGEIVKVVQDQNPAKLPTLIVGDFNSSKWATPSNGPYDTFTAAGYRDPLGNGYQTTKTAPGATVERRIHTTYSSYGAFQRQHPNKPTWINGSYIDYIFTSKLRVAEYENVVKLDGAGNWIGTIPSDHTMQRVTVYFG